MKELIVDSPVKDQRIYFSRVYSSGIILKQGKDVIVIRNKDIPTVLSEIARRM